jgi:hypothetical protein
MCVNHDPYLKADTISIECVEHPVLIGVYITPAGIPFRPTMAGRPGAARQACYKVYVGDEAINNSDDDFYVFPESDCCPLAAERKRKEDEEYVLSRKKWRQSIGIID